MKQEKIYVKYEKKRLILPYKSIETLSAISVGHDFLDQIPFPIRRSGFIGKTHNRFNVPCK